MYNGYGNAHVCRVYVEIGGKLGKSVLSSTLTVGSGILLGSGQQAFSPLSSSLALTAVSQSSLCERSEEPETFHLLFVLHTPLLHSLFPPLSFSIPPLQKQSPGKRKGISSHGRRTTAGKKMCDRNTCVYMYEMP